MIAYLVVDTAGLLEFVHVPPKSGLIRDSRGIRMESDPFSPGLGIGGTLDTKDYDFYSKIEKNVA